MPQTAQRLLEVGQLKAAGALRVFAELQRREIEAAVVQEAPEAHEAPSAELLRCLRRPHTAGGAAAPAGGGPGPAAGAAPPGLHVIQMRLQRLARGYKQGCR